MADKEVTGLTEIGEDLVDADLIVVSNASDTTELRGSLLSRIWTYVLAKDGAGSGLDADLLDGQHAAAFESAGAAAAAQSAAEATAAAALTAHTTDASAAHAASAISNTPAGNLTATDVQAALDELQGDIDGLQYPRASEDETGTTYTFVAGDQNKIKTFTNASAVTATVDGSVHSTNDRITARAGGAGGTTIAEGAGMTFDPAGSVVLAEGQVAELVFTSAVTADVFAPGGLASTTSPGTVELATTAETSAGDDDTRAVTPDGLSGSIYGAKEVGIVAFASDVATAVGDGDIAYCVPASLNGMNLTAAVAAVHTAGTTGTTDVQVRRRRDTTDADMLSTKLTIDSGETRSITAAAAAVIDVTTDDVATGDLIFVDVDAVAATPATGMFVTLTFSAP